MLVVTSMLHPHDTEFSEHWTTHGDAIRDIAFTVVRLACSSFSILFFVPSLLFSVFLSLLSFLPSCLFVPLFLSVFLCQHFFWLYFTHVIVLNFVPLLFFFSHPLAHLYIFFVFYYSIE